MGESVDCIRSETDENNLRPDDGQLFDQYGYDQHVGFGEESRIYEYIYETSRSG